MIRLLLAGLYLVIVCSAHAEPLNLGEMPATSCWESSMARNIGIAEQPCPVYVPQETLEG
ncbi:MAG: hypothetical protein J2P54_01630 [Bradyrhizobiaceae bacterium]|nr:hypothetical protein [Bradyrhizobiaceae bacterium]